MPLRVKRGKWEYRFSVNGLRVSRLTDLEAIEPNRTKAERLEKQHRDRILQGHAQPRQPRSMRFLAAVEEFIEHCEALHQDHPSTVARVRTSLASLRAFFERRAVAAITAPDIERYKAWRLGDHKVKPITLRHDLDALSKFFRWAVRMKLVSANPVAEVQKPSTESAIRMHIYTAVEEKCYFEKARDRSMDLHDLGRIMLNQGMRPEEILGLQRRHVDLIAGTILVSFGKTKSARRTLLMTNETRCILTRRIETAGMEFAQHEPRRMILARRLSRSTEDIKERDQQRARFIFPARRFGKRGSYHLSLSGLENVHNDVLRACKSEGCEIPAVIYDFRHTFATRAAENHVPLATLAAILGHSSIRIVQRYVHPSQQHQFDEMRRLDQLRSTEKSALSVPAERASEPERGPILGPLRAHSGPRSGGKQAFFEGHDGKREESG